MSVTNLEELERFLKQYPGIRFELLMRSSRKLVNANSYAQVSIDTPEKARGLVNKLQAAFCHEAYDQGFGIYWIIPIDGDSVALGLYWPKAPAFLRENDLLPGD